MPPPAGRFGKGSGERQCQLQRFVTVGNRSRQPSFGERSLQLRTSEIVSPELHPVDLRPHRSAGTLRQRVKPRAFGLQRQIDIPERITGKEPSQRKAVATQLRTVGFRCRIESCGRRKPASGDRQKQVGRDTSAVGCCRAAQGHFARKRNAPPQSRIGQKRP